MCENVKVSSVFLKWEFLTVSNFGSYMLAATGSQIQDCIRISQKLVGGKAWKVPKHEVSSYILQSIP